MITGRNEQQTARWAHLLQRLDGETLSRGIKLGVISGIVATIVMDIVMVAELWLADLEPLAYLDLIGSAFGGGAALGVPMHLVMSVFLGLIFTAPLLLVDALYIDTLKKGVVVGALIGLATIPFCVPFAMLVGEPIVKLVSFSTIPHLVWGVVFGVVAGYRLRSHASS